MGAEGGRLARYVATIRRSGLSIYDGIDVGDPELWIPTPELEALLDRGLKGVSLAGLPLRTRSKVVKGRVCESLGYPVPASFKKTQPRFPGQLFDERRHVRQEKTIRSSSRGLERSIAILLLDGVSTIFSAITFARASRRESSHQGGAPLTQPAKNHSRRNPPTQSKSSVSRRRFLGHMFRSGALVTASSSRVAAQKGPAILKGTTLHCLFGQDFSLTVDPVLSTIAKNFGIQAGVTVSLETINANDLLPRLVASIQSGSGPDVSQVRFNWARLFSSSFEDVSDIADALNKRDGGFYVQPTIDCTVDKLWRAVPLSVIPVTYVWNVEQLTDIGEAPPKTWDEYGRVAVKLKAKGYPTGWTLSNDSFGAGLAYPLLWSFGSREVDAEGKKVVLDSKETRDALGFMASLSKLSSENTLSSDTTPGSSANAFLDRRSSGTVASAKLFYQATRRSPDVAKNLRYASLPKGRAGVFHRHETEATAVLKTSKIASLAREFIRFLMRPENLIHFLGTPGAGRLGPAKIWEADSLWQAAGIIPDRHGMGVMNGVSRAWAANPSPGDPVLRTVKGVGDSGREIGYPGPPSKAASEVFSKFIVIDMCAKVVQGATVDEVVKWAAKQLVSLYAH